MSYCVRLCCWECPTRGVRPVLCCVILVMNKFIIYILILFDQNLFVIISHSYSKPPLLLGVVLLNSLSKFMFSPVVTFVFSSNSNPRDRPKVFIKYSIYRSRAFCTFIVAPCIWLNFTFYFTNLCTCKSININVNTLKH